MSFRSRDQSTKYIRPLSTSVVSEVVKRGYWAWLAAMGKPVMAESVSSATVGTSVTVGTENRCFARIHVLRISVVCMAVDA